MKTPSKEALAFAAAVTVTPALPAVAAEDNANWFSRQISTVTDAVRPTESLVQKYCGKVKLKDTSDDGCPFSIDLYLQFVDANDDGRLNGTLSGGGVSITEGYQIVGEDGNRMAEGDIVTIAYGLEGQKAVDATIVKAPSISFVMKEVGGGYSTDERLTTIYAEAEGELDKAKGLEDSDETKRGRVEEATAALDDAYRALVIEPSYVTTGYDMTTTVSFTDPISGKLVNREMKSTVKFEEAEGEDLMAKAYGTGGRTPKIDYKSYPATDPSDGMEVAFKNTMGVSKKPDAKRK